MENFSDVVHQLGLEVKCSDLPSTIQYISGLKHDEIKHLHSKLHGSLPKPSASKLSDHSFVSNSEGSGLPFPCASIECCNSAIRLSATISAMYADDVVLFNPFSTIFSPHIINETTTRSYARNLSSHLYNVMSIYPAIRHGIVKFEDFDNVNICSDCFSRGMAGSIKADSSNSTNLLFMSSRYFLRRTNATLYSRKDKKVSILIDGMEEFAGHDRIIHTALDRDGVLSSLSVGDQVDTAALVSLEVIQQPATFLVNDIASIADISNRYKKKNIISSGAHISILREYLGEEIVKHGTNASFPLTNATNLDSVIKFREQEWHHLHDFREFVSKGIESGADVSKEIQYESQKIEKIIMRSKRAFKNKMNKEVSILVGAAATAIVSSGFSTIASATLGILGAGHLAKNVAPLISEYNLEPEDVRQSDVYYAWKLRKSLA